MKVKRKEKFILGFLITLLLILGFFYVKYTTFTSHSISHVQIINSAQEVLDQFDFDAKSPYQAFDKRISIEDPKKIHANIDEPLYLNMINQFKNTKLYKIIDINNDGFILESSDDATYILLPHSNMISSSKALLKYYPELMPSTLTLNQMPITSIALNTWSYRSRDNQWIDLTDEEWQHLESTNTSYFDLQSDDIQLDFHSDKPYSLGMLKVLDSKNNQVVYEAELEDNSLFVPEYDGTFTYQLQLIYSDDVAYRGDLTAKFTVEIDRPIKVTLDKDQIEQGDYSVLSIQYASETDHFTVEQFPYEVEFFKGKSDLRAILYADYRTKAGDYPFIVKDSSNGEHWPLKFKIIPRKFHIQQLVIDESVAKSTKNDTANAEFAQKYSPLRMQSSDKDLTDGDYMIPTTGRLSTEYGETRYVNGSPTSYRHSGLDIATPRGTHVYATNSGKVLLATPLILTGNTILIDHGQGIFSTYFHLNKLTVKEGEMVKKGDLIGEVGTTGFSTGPHLHFIISYYNHNLEPGYFLVGEPITYNNYKKFLK